MFRPGSRGRHPENRGNRPQAAERPGKEIETGSGGRDWSSGNRGSREGSGALCPKPGLAGPSLGENARPTPERAGDTRQRRQRRRGRRACPRVRTRRPETWWRFSSEPALAAASFWTTGSTTEAMAGPERWGTSRSLADGPLCGCGRKGCAEGLASRTAMERDMRQPSIRGAPAWFRTSWPGWAGSA